ncbi:TetR family transcriptional regulator [Brachybacterium paraconglomeratum]|uniref:TetR family transcriptional regulator n=1 Tax=Brachybacterium paraconglomeratum TaxID=173362 RepID=UPI0022AFD6BA|nr:TetR family transcriptional regulator [Brachybacterium paraconglomeratum]MCZ4327502.1 TetR family transcriptional regulator [Brachybacterium paraconglomeratum]
MTTNAENIRACDTKVIAAGWRLIARDGVLALTVQALADEAGVAVSSMRYTMPSRGAVRERALEAIAPSIRVRIGARPVDSEGAPSVSDCLSPHCCRPRCCRSTRIAGSKRLC